MEFTGGAVGTSLFLSMGLNDAIRYDAMLLVKTNPK
jgi:hypothetical protein